MRLFLAQSGETETALSAAETCALKGGAHDCCPAWGASPPALSLDLCTIALMLVSALTLTRLTNQVVH